MRALVYRDSLPRLAWTKVLGAISRRAFVGRAAPLQLEEIADPVLPAEDWVLLRTRLCGVCGSDAKQVSLNGATDNPMTALISFPQVLGHEVVAEVAEVGPRVRRLRPGDRVVLNPWLSCAPRGVPLCAWCLQGEFALCENFTQGHLDPGIHTGNSRHATGGFAPFLPAHESMCFLVPDEITDEAAVLADPFAVSLHAVLHSPPPQGGRVLVYGCGTLGLLTIPILRILDPSLEIAAVARFPHQRRLAEELGAHRVFDHRPTREIISAVATWCGVPEHKPWRGLPMLQGGVDRVYDSVGSPETLEVGVRVARARGIIAVTGVETPKRFEWTPLYFKEISLRGSNAFAVEEIDGRRMHAMEWYFDWIQNRGLDVTSILTHRYALEDYREALMASLEQRRSGAVKVLFDFRATVAGA